MSTETVNSIYTVVETEGAFGIFGKDAATGEALEIKTFTRDKLLAEELAAKLNKGRVSLCHAKDVVLDEIIKTLI